MSRGLAVLARALRAKRRIGFIRMRLLRPTLVTIGLATCLLLLMVQPAAGVALLFCLAPDLLFGLVLVPPSLWLAAEVSPRAASAGFGGPERFQRPPPFFLL